MNGLAPIFSNIRSFHLPLPVKIFFHCLMVVLSAWGRHGFAASTADSIQERNSQFMHYPTFIEELYTTGQIATTSVDTLTRLPLTAVYRRQDIEAGSIPIQFFKKPRYAPQEIYRLVEERIEDMEVTRGRRLTPPEKIKIQHEVISQTIDAVDSQVIEGVALTIADAPPERLLSLFANLDHFRRMAPNIFLESSEIRDPDLRARNIAHSDNIKFQYSKIQIAGVQFSQTLRYGITSEFKAFQKRADTGISEVQLECFNVAWEIDPLFKEDETFAQHGVLVNSGRFVIEPYRTEDGLVDLSRSIILYHIYIKIDPLNYLIDILHKLFSGSEAREVLNELAMAMRREVRRQ